MDGQDDMDNYVIMTKSDVQHAPIESNLPRLWAIWTPHIVLVLICDFLRVKPKVPQQIDHVALYGTSCHGRRLCQERGRWRNEGHKTQGSSQDGYTLQREVYCESRLEGGPTPRGIPACRSSLICPPAEL